MPINEPFETSRRIEQVFADQAANRHLVATTDHRQRILKLRTLLDWVFSNQGQIQEALALDFQKPAPEVDISEVWMVAAEIKHAIRNLRRWMRPRKVRRTLATLTARSWIQYEPRGVVLIVSPWNYPFNLTLGPLASAIAAGNCAILKPSEFTPHASALMAQMATELFSENEVAVFEGDQEVAIELLKQPFDHIFFTGSTETGKKVMRAASEHLSTITLELGGKSPAIIDKTAHIADAAQKIVWGKYITCGQTCIAPDYLLVQEERVPDVLKALKKEINRVYGDSPDAQHTNPDYGRIVDRRHFDRLRTLLEKAVEQGAKIEVGGESVAEERFFAPTILTDVKSDSPIMQEEIFGPILPVLPYRKIKDAIHLINAGPKPLALYIFSHDRRVIDTVLSQTSAGGTCINDVVMQFLHMNLPFGGVNHSGAGSAHGFYGFKAFSHERAVVKHTRYSPLKLLSPPYTEPVKKLITFVSRHL